MRYCQECLLPDTRPNLHIFDDGVCNGCAGSKSKLVIDWEAREKKFRQLVDKVREEDNDYDCVIPVSGGKDSTWQVLKCLEYGLKPLAVTWATPARTEIGKANLENLIAIGVDHIDFRINPKVESRFMLEAFRAHGSTAIPMHMAIFQIPPKVAVAFNIKLVVWGENPALEYGGTREEQLTFNLTEEFFRKFGVTSGTTAEDWVSDKLTKRDLAAYFGPSAESLRKNAVSAVFLGSFFDWDVEKTHRVSKDHGFLSNTQGPKTGLYNYADIDCDFISIHHWMKWYKFGFTRLMDNLSLEIRRGRLSRSEAIEIVRQRGAEFPESDIEKFCRFVGIEQAQFFHIAETFRNKSVWSGSETYWWIPDFLIDDFDWNKQ